MTFKSRMLEPTGAEEPRWLYLVRKVCDTSAITILVWKTLGGETWIAALYAAVVYALTGQIAWWTRHAFTWWGNKGRGGVLGDVVYHLWIGLLPAIVVRASSVLAMLGGIVVWALVWWQLDTAGFGPVRAP